MSNANKQAFQIEILHLFIATFFLLKLFEIIFRI